MSRCTLDLDLDLGLFVNLRTSYVRYKTSPSDRPCANFKSPVYIFNFVNVVAFECSTQETQLHIEYHIGTATTYQ